MEIVKDTEQEGCWYIIEGDRKVGGISTAERGKIYIWAFDEILNVIDDSPQMKILKFPRSRHRR